MIKKYKRLTGSFKLTDPIFIIGVFILAAIVSYVVAFGGLRFAIAIMFLPIGVVYLNKFFNEPHIGLISVIVFSFLAIGIGRYIPGVPVGLSIDAILVLTFLAVIFKNFYTKLNPKAFRNDLVYLMAIWFLYSVAQIFNPEALSKTAWFYAMRGISLYCLLIIPLTFLLFNKVKYVNIFLYLWGAFSIFGAFKGFLQLYIGPDYAEQRWLNEVGAITHILFGELRVFSFYSDAGQFGAAQGAAGIVGIICALNVKNNRDKIFFWIMGLSGIYGMMISGTRGAIIVPTIGALIYLIHRKNLKVIFLGFVALILVYSFFKFTTLGQGVAQIRRMRTAFDPDSDASLQIRLDNRAILQVYLESRPFGGGIGSAGDWGKRFSPTGFLANVATDSWYVQIWAEQGIIGLTLHLIIIAYIFVKSSYLIMFKIDDPELRGKMSALAAGFAGIAGASYGNGVLGQIPTGTMVYMSWAFMFMSPMFDRELKALKALNSV